MVLNRRFQRVVLRRGHDAGRHVSAAVVN
jgi:hypothetical protein